MGSCGRSVTIDDPLGESVIEQHLCSEVAELVVSGQEGCVGVDSNVEHSTVNDGCVSSGDLALGLVSECENVGLLPLERTAEDDCEICLGFSCGSIEVSCLKSGAEGDCQDEGNSDFPLRSMFANDSQKHCVQHDEQKDDKTDKLPAAGDELAVVEGKKDDAGALSDALDRVFDCRDSEMSLESEPAADMLLDCNQQNERGDILTNADTLLNVVEKCDAVIGKEADTCKQISPSLAMEVPSSALCSNTEIESTSNQPCDQKDDEDQNSTCEEKVKAFADEDSNINSCVKISSSPDCLRTVGTSPLVDSSSLAMEAEAFRQTSSVAMEVPSGALCTETVVENTRDQPCDQKDGEDQSSICEEKVKAFVDQGKNIDSCVKISSSPSCQGTFGSSPIVDSPSPAMEADACRQTSSLAMDVPSGALCTEIEVESSSDQPYDQKDSEDHNNTCEEKVNAFVDEGNNINSCVKVSPSPGCHGTVGSSPVVDSPCEPVPLDLGCEMKNGMLQIEDGFCKFKDLQKRSCRRTKSGCKTQTKKPLRKRNNKAKVTRTSVNLEVAMKKKRSSGRLARLSTWGLVDNIEQFFNQDNELGVGEAVCQESGKARSKRQSRKVVKNGTSSLSSAQKYSVPTSCVRLKIKFGKDIGFSCSNVLIPDSVDGLASVSNMGSGAGSQKVVNSAEDKISEAVALINSESFNNDLDKDGIVLNGQVANNPLENTEITEKSDGDADEPCLAVPPEKVVEALIEPINIKGMDPGTSPDSEVINSIPEVPIGERQQEDIHLTVLGSSKELNPKLDVTFSKRGKKKNKLISEGGSQCPSGNSGAKHSKNHRQKKNCRDAVSSSESMPLSGEIELGSSAEALKVKNHLEVKTSSKPSLDHELSESQGSENLVPSARSMGQKLPKSLKPKKVSKTKSKASDSIGRKKTSCTRKEKQKKPINKSKVKGKSVSHKVTCEVEDCSHPESIVDVNHKLDSVGKINVGDNEVLANVSKLDLLPGVGFGEQLLSPRNAWVRCDDCHKWRRIPAVLADRIDETNCTWTCKDSSDKSFADCAIPQEKSNAEINAELGLSEASGEEDAYEGSKNFKELDYRPPLVFQESTFTHIFTNEFLHRRHKTQTIDEIMVCHCKPPQEGKLGCGDECLNRILNIECVQGTCPCGDLCSNQQFQKRKYASLRWFKCGKKGYGLKALVDVAQGQFLIEYVGEVLDMQTYEARQREYALKGHRHFYFMTLNGSEVIDASAKGNLGRFINHSCDPNCRTEKWMVNGEICIGLFALRDIKQDEELTFDYNYVRVFGAAAKKCYCGSPNCRGYIGGGDPLNAELIVQSDSEEEFPEPVMLTKDGEIEDAVPAPKYCNNVDTQSARDMLKEREILDKSTTVIGLDGSPEKECSMNPSSAVSLLRDSVEMDDSKGKLSSSVRVEEIPPQMEDVTGKSLAAVQQGYEKDSEFGQKTSIQRLENTSPLTTVNKTLTNSSVSSKESKSEIIEGKRAPKLKGSVKKGKVHANSPNGLKAEVTANRLQVSSIKHKKVDGSSNGRFEAVQEKLNELLDGDGGISKRKDATKGYLKLLFLTVASGDRSNGEAIQSNRDLSMILDALLKTKSRAVLNDIINKNGLQMLHNIMKQYRLDFKKIPILRKLLKVLEYLAASKILTSEHINGGPPCHGMESFRESMLSLTEHDDKQVHQIARSFRDRWFTRHLRKHGYMDRDDNRVENHRSFTASRFSSSHRHEQDLRPTEAIDCSQQSMLVRTSVDADAPVQSLDGVEIKGAKKRKRKSRWDQPAETNSHSDAVMSSIGESQNIHEDVPPGFSCPIGSLNASLNSCNLAFQNGSHSGYPSDLVIGRPKEKFNSCMPVSYGIPWSVAQQCGTPHIEFAGCWVTAPGMPFNPFPPTPPFQRGNKDCQPSNTDAMIIDQPAEVKQWDTSGMVNCSDDMIPSTTAANPEDSNLLFEDNKHITKHLKDDSNDLGRKYFRQQKWNNSKIHRTWFKRNAWSCNVSNSSGDMCSVDLGDVPKESKLTSDAEDAICREEKSGNNIY